MKTIEQVLFRPSPIDVFLNPSFIARRGLYRHIKRASVHAVGRVLDYGCGRKPYCSLFSAAAIYHGIDTHHSGHDHSKTKADFFYDGQRMPFSDGEFDTVFSSQVLEHVPDIHVSLGEIHRVLKDGGHFIFSVPFMWGEHERPHDYRRFTRWGVESLLSQAGFKAVSIAPTAKAVPTFGQLFTAWVADAICGNRKWIVYPITPFVFAPLHLLSYLLSLVLPDNGHWYLDLVVVAKKDNN